ncbi:MAG: hypothetical protein M1823_005966 [Watsoniomyces obsoletus]|nr:MAG: hypothetical protein M1823_005966 [Watsoniomyces obsoletus]
MTETTMNALLDQVTKATADVKKLAGNDATRRKLIEASRKLSEALETPGESMQRVMYKPLYLTTARIAVDLNLFELVSKAPEGWTVNALAKEVKADPAFLGRLLRYMASVGMLEEAGEDHFKATQTTHVFSKPGARGGIIHNHDTVLPCWSATPRFLAETGYKNPSDMSHGPGQMAHQTAEPLFRWLPKHPVNFTAFNQWMTAQREGQPSFLSVFPAETMLLKGATPETPIFVDVGGGVGHQSVAFREKFPDAPGRVILQDIPPVIEQAVSHPGVEKMGINFWEPEPIKGARAYYLRNILHDYPDDKCAEILERIKVAMTDDSVILIDEMVLPNVGQHYMQCQIDWTMLSALAAVERSRKQWESLMELAGLKIREIYPYTDDMNDAIIVAVPK